ncbi:hypothetical protein HNW77_01505 [Komagataeibacter sp. AV436]|uniref:Uncharacterized protein n=1 Tax=Komagataeibacter melomenusus TaxID=2766578 RepID=A0ABX2ABV9_9PROT|nr:hypothetical protein [Komagataeibacter melomenusus]MBV1829697.1 hypothetical protein [Komagataeibacter melomenusus]NPC65102.1 hypothetical protein [Komagataeibacter melomenusus]
MKHIKVMADYACYPLWHAGPRAGEGDFDPATLPISDGLKKDLDAWRCEFDAILDWNDPGGPNTGFETPDTRDAFDRQGTELAARLQSELGTQYRVSVQPCGSGYVRNPSRGLDRGP